MINIRSLLAQYVIGSLRVEELPRFAAEALVEGLDSPSLRQLAGAGEEDAEECWMLFHRVIRELELEVPSPDAAGLVLARDIAEEVVSGTLSPYVGAKRIWSGIYTILPGLSQLRPFVGFASQYEDDVSNRDRNARLILEECVRFLDGAP